MNLETDYPNGTVPINDVRNLIWADRRNRLSLTEFLIVLVSSLLIGFLFGMAYGQYKYEVAPLNDAVPTTQLQPLL